MRMVHVCGLVSILGFLPACKEDPPKEGNRPAAQQEGQDGEDGEDGEDQQVEETVYEQFCGQLDECNSLEGMSPDECVAYFVECADGLLASEASDVEAAAAECVSEYDGCTSFSDCYWYDIPYC